LVGVLGVGRWGKNYVKTLRELDIPFATCDIKDNLAKFLRKVDRVIICTPSSTHFKLAQRCLRADKDVLIEKPIVFNTKQFDSLFFMAKERKKILYPALLMEHHPAVKELKEMDLSPDHVEMVRTKLRKPRKDTPILWNLALHDLSTAIYLFGHITIWRGHQLEEEGYLVLQYPTFTVIVRVSYNEEKRARTVIYRPNKIVFDDVGKTLQIGQKTISVEESPLKNLILSFISQNEMDYGLIKRARLITSVLEEI